MAETPNPETRYYNPKFRRRRKYQGATWTPERQSADLHDGAWCRSCRQRHGYKTMNVAYEKATDGRWKALWSCKSTGAVIEEMRLGSE